MRILIGKPADGLRARFIGAFVNTKGEYYRSAIRETRLHEDGMCYIGFLRDCLKDPVTVTEPEALAELRPLPSLCAMWDIHSKDMIRIPGYWRYPKRAVLELTPRELDAVLPTLPKDVYLFDRDCGLAAALTGEYDEGGRRRCLLCKNI